MNDGTSSHEGEDVHQSCVCHCNSNCNSEWCNKCNSYCVQLVTITTKTLNMVSIVTINCNGCNRQDCDCNSASPDK